MRHRSVVGAGFLSFRLSVVWTSKLFNVNADVVLHGRCFPRRFCVRVACLRGPVLATTRAAEV